MDSERRAKEDDQALAVSTPNRFAAVAHDLRNPLAVIEFSAARLIHDGSTERHIIDDGLQRILRSVHHAERLVEDLFDAATRQSGTLDLRPTAVPAAQLLADAKAAGEALASKASVTLDVQSASDLPSVRVDADRIAQVFENLIGNAAKFTSQGGRITLPETSAVMTTPATLGPAKSAASVNGKRRATSSGSPGMPPGATSMRMPPHEIANTRA